MSKVPPYPDNSNPPPQKKRLGTTYWGLPKKFAKKTSQEKCLAKFPKIDEKFHGIFKGEIISIT